MKLMYSIEHVNTANESSGKNEAAEKQGHRSTRGGGGGGVRARSSTVAASIAHGSSIHLLNELRSKTEPITEEEHSLWSACSPAICGQLLITAAGLHLPRFRRRDWLSLVQGRPCAERGLQ